MEAIILAGGFGTRLKSVVSDLPKPMAPIGNRPFLAYILDYLLKQGISRVILSTGYKHEVIEDHFGDKYKELEVCYSIEKQPLGTGGAIKKALDLAKENAVLILNGDTFFNVDLQQLAESHSKLKSDLTLSLKPMENFDRYGVVLTSGSRVIQFEEKKHVEKGNINGGIYLANRSLFDGITMPEKFSFETDFMEKYNQQLNFNVFISDGYFIDIGIPSDYEKAQLELPKIL